MTVAYNFDISSSSWFSITKVLLRWKGSVWKAVISELLFWFTIYAVLNFSLRTLLNQHQTENFKAVRLLLADCLPRIPLSLLLGFFVNIVFGRWAEIFRRIGFIDNVALVVAHLIEGNDPETRLLRRRIVRYAVLSQTLVFRDISLEVRKRFPDIETIVSVGIMTEHEYDLLTSKLSRNSKYWIPIQWAMKLAWKAREQGKIVNDVVAFQLTEKLREFRTDLQMLCCFDWVPVPLAYPQIVILAVRCYMLITIIARQTLGSEFIIPCMTILELVLLMGWVKVAETLLNPLGTDDDDFECSYVIDRNLSLGFEIVDGIPMPSPEDVDIFWRMESPLPLDNILHSRKRNSTYAGSVADIDVTSMEKQYQMSVNSPVTRQSTIRRRMSRRVSHDQMSQEFPTIFEEGSVCVMPKEENMRLVTFGDGGCGKTCLLIVFSKNQFPIGHIPTAFDNYVASIEIDEKQVGLTLLDQDRLEDGPDVLRLVTQLPDVILLCFNIGSPDSFKNAIEKWAPMARYLCPDVPIALVGNMKDLRNDLNTILDLKRKKQKPVEEEEGRIAAAKIGAYVYLECSAKNNEGIHDVLEKSTRVALLQKKYNCNVM